MLNALVRRSSLPGLLAAALLAFGGSAQAENRLHLEPPGEFVELGQPFEVALAMDFSDTTTGGGVRLAYDPALLSLDAVAFNGVLAGDPDFQCPASGSPLVPVSCPGTPGLVSFGSVSGLVGTYTVATLTFTPLVAGTAAIPLELAYGFGTSGGGELAVLLEGTAVTTATSVPSLSVGGGVALVLLLIVAASWKVKNRRAAPGAAWVAGVLLFLFVVPPGSAQVADADLDGVLDSLDNCTNVANPDQRDTDGDGYGNFCDADLDNDTDIDSSDLDLLKARFFGSDPDADFDGSGTVDFLDLGHMAGQFGGTPGPTCGACPPVDSASFTATPFLAIPDDVGVGATDTQAIVEDIAIVDLAVQVVITHSWVGDLKITLTHVDTGTSAVLMARPGEPASAFGCSGDDIDVTFSDDAADPVEDACATGTPSIGGSLSPDDALAVFDGESTAGSWELTVLDSSSASSGTLEEWTLGVNNPPAPSAITMTAFRPQSETYGNPLQRRFVAEADELSPGAGIRINGDDDDGNGTPDRDDASVAGENDLIEVELGVNQLTPPNTEYVLRRTDSTLRVWDSATKDT
ncbi:MAG: proprotein convertase P-domain-containing protein, partial [Myxococcota bacterium]|nr:proprotein convertase P-domain-containing protein [Myxococcota bacterium]